jgi:hypothetical protein
VETKLQTKHLDGMLELGDRRQLQGVDGNRSDSGDNEARDFLWKAELTASTQSPSTTWPGNKSEERQRLTSSSQTCFRGLFYGVSLCGEQLLAQYRVSHREPFPWHDSHLLSFDDSIRINHGAVSLSHRGGRRRGYTRDITRKMHRVRNLCSQLSS